MKQDHKNDLQTRFIRWFIIAIAGGTILYVGGSVWVGFEEMGEELQNFQWIYFVYALLLTLLNYGLRFVKWHYYIRRLNVDIPVIDNAWNFVAGLSMAISPGKAGEVLKSYVIRERTGTPMAQTIPAVITERLTDAIAMLLLAGIGITTYAADQIHYVIIPAIIALAGIGVLLHEGISLTIIDILGKIGPLSKITPKLKEMLKAMRTCVAPIALLWTTSLGFVAWGAECVAFQLIFIGLGVQAPLDVCLFLYSFATIAGSALVPGGIGVADGALSFGALQYIPNVVESQAVAAAFLVRIATMWFGVGLGSLALFKVSQMLGGRINLDDDEQEK